MTRPRDTQRSKLYRAEKVLWREPFDQTKFTSHDEVRGYVASVLKDKSLRDVYGELVRKPPVVKQGTKAPYGSIRGISVPLRMATKAMVLHEVAHWLEDKRYGSTYAWHGPAFCRVYINLVRAGMGAQAGFALVKAFDDAELDTVHYAPTAIEKSKPEPEKPLVLERWPTRGIRRQMRPVIDGSRTLT